jgi:hypothetical protein
MDIVQCRIETDLYTHLSTKMVRLPNLLPESEADRYYSLLLEKIFVPKIEPYNDPAHALQSGSEFVTLFPELFELLKEKIEFLRTEYKIRPTFFSCNCLYYPDGRASMFPHSHPAQTQFILSLGETRTLLVSGESIEMKTGDAVIFGPLEHEVPIEEHVTGGRISIVLFYS